ncbi:TrpR YerC/YecD [Candidatus Peregrinibacteria bacterium]|jgi:TrpR-related protein YerC/YecD|nr:TrpR YerC/YecD [Candidatus Peregrinibacteria bacterium]
MAKKVNNKALNEVYEAVLKLETADECKKFFRDLCTMSELNSMAERFVVAKMVDQKIPYREISKKTGSSTATITRVAHWLHHGKGGYKLVLERT